MFLGRNYRLSVFNDSGADVAVVITVRRMKFVNGVLTFESSEQTLINATVSTGASAVSAALDNSSDAWVFLEGLMKLTGTATGGPVSVFYQASTDGGTNFNAPRRGRFLGSAIPNDITGTPGLLFRCS